MQSVSGMMIAGIVTMILMRGLMTGTDSFDEFIEGAGRGVKSATGLLPTLMAMLLLLAMFTASGADEILTSLLSPATRLLGIPQELTALLLLRPLTGSGSLAALEKVLSVCGPDSRAGRIASVAMGSSETIFYTMSVYMSAAGVKKLPHAVLASLVSYAASVLFCCMLY